MTEINLNDAEISTGDYELIPDGTIAKVSMLVKPGGEGEGGWLTQAASGNLYLNCEFVVTEGKYARGIGFGWWQEKRKGRSNERQHQQGYITSHC